MSEFKPIQTKYGGRTYKSKFEAQFAAYLDIMGISYEYEDGSKTLSNKKIYRPDFLIHTASKGPDFYVEVKGKTPYMEDGIKKMEEFSEEGHRVILFGPEWPWNIDSMRNDFINDPRFHSGKFFRQSMHEDDFFIVQGLFPGWHECQPYDSVVNTLSSSAKHLFDECVNKAMKTAFDYFVNKEPLDDKPSLSPDAIEVEKRLFDSQRLRDRAASQAAAAEKREKLQQDILIKMLNPFIAEEIVEHFIDECGNSGHSYLSVIAQMISDWDDRYWELFHYDKQACHPKEESELLF